MHKKDFEKMSINEIRSLWLADISSCDVDGRMDLLTPWEYRMLVKELLHRIEKGVDMKDKLIR